MTEIAITVLGIILLIAGVAYFKFRTPKMPTKPSEEIPTRDEIVSKLMSVESQLGQIDNYRQVELIARSETRNVHDPDIQNQLNLYLNDQIVKRIKLEQSLIAEKDMLMSQLRNMNQVRRPSETNMQDNN